MHVISTLLLAHTLLFQSPQQLKIDSLNHELATSIDKNKVIILNELFKLYRNNNPAKALEYTEEALIIAKRHSDYSGIASSLNNIGVVHRHRGDLDKALASYIEALHIQEDHKFDDALAYTYNNIGTIYSLKNNYKKALEYFLKAYVQFESINHKLRIVGSLNNIGNVYATMGDYNKALGYYLKSVEYYDSLEDKNQAFVPYTNIGNAYLNLGDADRALEFYNKSLVYEQADNNTIGEANALHNFGTVFKTMNDYDQAIEFFNLSLSKAQETGDRLLLKTIYESLANVNFMKGDFFMAYSFLQLHNVAKDSLFNEESNRRIAELENAYEFDQQQKQIEFLKTAGELQRLQIKNDKNIIIATISISLLGIMLSVIIFKEYKEIKKNKKLLEIKTEEIIQRKDEIEAQKQVIEEKNDNITESINYAKSIQKSILKFEATPDKLNNSFILFKPKDIVSGDFFWYNHFNGIDVFVTADCTGHGVAGAFMTVIGITLLNEIVNKEEITDPKEILRALDQKVMHSLQQQATHSGTHGMDVSICLVDVANKKVTYSGAGRPLYYFQKGEFYKIKGSSASIGDSIVETKEFENHIITCSSGDSFYMFSDGYPDQFGGPDNKKFLTKRLKSLLIEVQGMDMADQKDRLNKDIEEWMKNSEQTDDIVVTGFQML